MLFRSRVLTVEDHNIYAGFGGAVAEALGEYCPVPVLRMGVRDTFGESAHNQPLLEKYGLTVQHIVSQAHEWVSHTGRGSTFKPDSFSFTMRGKK